MAQATAPSSTLPRFKAPMIAQVHGGSLGYFRMRRIVHASYTLLAVSSVQTMGAALVIDKGRRRSAELTNFPALSKAIRRSLSSNTKVIGAVDEAVVLPSNTIILLASFPA